MIGSGGAFANPAPVTTQGQQHGLCAQTLQGKVSLCDMDIVQLVAPSAQGKRMLFDRL
jgi:hypothetical protein